MQNHNDDGYDLDDDLYDDVLDEGFEEEFEDSNYSDLDLDTDDYVAEAGDEEWDDLGEEDYLESGAGVQKEKSRFSMSFNALVITGAIIVGMLVLGYQLITTKSTIIQDTFQSALRMGGATDGPVFGKKDTDTAGEGKSENVDNSEAIKGFLYEPNSLDSMQMELSDASPMLTTAYPEPAVEGSETVNNALSPSLIQGKNVDIDADVNQVPRAPVDEVIDDSIVLDSELFNTEISEIEFTQKINEPVTPNVSVAVPVKTDDIKTEVFVSERSIGDSSNIEKKLEIIINRLDDMDIKITQIKEVGDLKIQDINDNIKSLKQNIGQLDSVPVQKKKMVSKPKTLVQKRSANKSVVPVKSKKPARAKVPKKVEWELRAAQPGKAWVSQKGHKNMKPVTIGDSLKGVGRITSISYDGRRWVVQGTSGRILQ